MLTTEQQNQINALTAAYNKASADANAAYAAYQSALNSANACQSARDAKSGGINKNKACHIDELNARNNMANAAAATYQSKLAIANGAKATLDNFMKTLADTNTLSQEALKGDAAFNIQAAQIGVNAQLDAMKTQSAAATAAAKAAAEKNAQDALTRRKNFIIIGISAIIFIALIILIIWFIKKLSKKSVITKATE